MKNIQEMGNKEEGLFLRELTWPEIDWKGIEIPDSLDEDDIDEIARNCIAQKKTGKAEVQKFIKIYLETKKAAES